ncbi:MAG: ABC transporter substrate-binding protein [Actinomycetota bacterium]
MSKFLILHRRARLLIGSTLVLLVLSGCGSDGEDQTSSETASATEAEEASDSSTSDEAEPASDSTTTSDPPTDEPAVIDECREIEHEMGTACVPVEPTRIIALDPLTVLPTLIAVDAPVLATISPYASGASFVDYLDETETDGIELIGSFDAELSLEEVAALEPDLIIGSISRLETTYELLQEIAPTVVTGYAFYDADWRDEIRLTADAAGHLDTADGLLADLDEQIVATRTALEAGPGTPTLTRVDVWQGTPLYYRFDCTWMGDLFSAVGLQQPTAQQADCSQGDPASAIGFLTLETLEVLEADAIVAYQQQATPDDVGRSPLDTLIESPLWPGLAAVERGDVHVFGDAWGLGGSIQAAEQILDDLTSTVYAG